MRVKACGAMTGLDLRAAKLGGADAVGVISPARSWPDYPASENSHTVSAEQNVRLREVIHDGMEFVWLPRRTTDFKEITDFARVLKPDRLQIGETEDPELAAALHEHYAGVEGAPKIAQVVHVNGADTHIEQHLGLVDYIHLDSPVQGVRFGGTGLPHNLEISAKLAEQAHAAGAAVILAGGLTVANVADAIAIVEPDEVDVETAIRSSSGGFSQLEIQRLVHNAHEAGAQL